MLTDLAIAFGRIIATEARGALKSILGNLELLEQDDSSSDEPLYFVPGYYCRPMPPVEEGSGSGLDPEGACEVVAVRVGDEVVPLAYRDLRLNSQVNPDEGELGLAHYGGGFISLKWNADTDGTNIMIYASRKDSSGMVVKASSISLDSADGNQHVSIMHEKGQSITLTEDEQVVIANKDGDAYLAVGGSDGVVVNSEKIAAAGAVMLGDKDPTSGEFVMLSAQLLAWITEANTAFAAIAAAATLNPNPTITAPTSVPVAATKVKAK